MARSPRDRREPRFESSRSSSGRGSDLRAPKDDRPTTSRRKRKEKSGRRAKRPRRSWLWSLTKLGFKLGMLAVVLIVGAIGYFAVQLPPIDTLTMPKRPPNIAILASDGSLIANRGATGGQEVPLAQLPDYLPKAFVATEDRRFYSHFGIDPIGLGRAMMINAMSGRLEQGGSTLTQQLAKNIYLDAERTISRKGKEAVLALWLERKYSKNQILELYMNRVYFGSGAYGIEAAAQRYFGKSARKVTLAEAATLAGLVRAPSRLAPNRNPEGARDRAAVVIGLMRDQGYVTAKEAADALKKGAKAVEPADTGTAQYAADWAVDLLDDYVGTVETDVVIATTISPDIQRAAENALVSEISKKGKRFRVSQGAIVSVAPDGAIRAMVGGVDYKQSQFNRAVTARRQPGSAFKPFVYLAALEKGYLPDSMVRDEKFFYGKWSPDNYARKYLGDVTMTEALAQSLNTPAAKLGIEVGPLTVARTAQRLGITSALNSSPSLALGSAEVTALELTAAYTAFANGGTGVIPYVITSIKDQKGKVLYKRKPQDLGRVIEEPQVAMMNAMLRETLLTGTGRRAALPGWQAAGKTGTSQDFRDAWFVGYTSALTTTVWLGNDDNDTTRKVSGGSLPVEIWSRMMQTALKGTKPVALLTDWRYSQTQEIVGEPIDLTGEVGSAERIMLPEDMAEDPEQQGDMADAPGNIPAQ
jgi:penicillin-binding protein 1A